MDRGTKTDGSQQALALDAWTEHLFWHRARQVARTLAQERQRTRPFVVERRNGSA